MALRKIDRIADSLKLVFEIARTKEMSTRAAAAYLAERRLNKGE